MPIHQTQGSKNSTFVCSLVEGKAESHLEQRFKMILDDKQLNNKKKASGLLVLVGCSLLIVSYIFIFQPYAEPDKNDYGKEVIISDDNYLVKNNWGYNMYNRNGEYIGYLDVIDDNLKHLIINNGGA